jgi:hypothetical protein
MPTVAGTLGVLTWANAAAAAALLTSRKIDPMNCRLCQRDRPLRRSHIIPEFAYRDTYDEKHRAILVSPSGQTRRVQLGLRRRLLCEECEQRVNRYERAFAASWKARAIRHVDPGRTFRTVIRGLDVKQFRLFHYSILWRASQPSLDSPADVNLDSLAEVLAARILADEPGDFDLLPINAHLFVDIRTGRVLHEVVHIPVEGVFSTGRIVSTIFGGCLWHYHLSSLPFWSRPSEFFQPDGRLPLGVVDVLDMSTIASSIPGSNGRGPAG